MAQSTKHPLGGVVVPPNEFYFGNETINAVTCVTTIQALAKALPCFSVCVKDVRMLKIEENNDLMPAVKAVL